MQGPSISLIEPRICNMDLTLGLGMARGIPRPSILEVLAFFALLEPQGIYSIYPRLLEVLAKTPRGPRKLDLFTLFHMKL